jgi:hypothetical protein
MIKINIFLAIYTYNNDIHRYTLTEKIFKHYKNIVEKFKDKAIFTFTIFGSENDISKNLTLRYFKSNSYVEFDQNHKSFKGDFYKMLGKKINQGINLSVKNDTDIVLWAGSNDYICFDFFEQIINYYNPEKPQIYGIDNYTNGKNAVFLTHYDGNRCVNKSLCLTSHKKMSYWWDGISDYDGRKKYKYSGGIIGINKKCLSLYPDILSVWGFDEGAIEEYILKKPQIDKFTSKNIFYMNIKTLSNTEITSFNTLKNFNKNNMLNFKDFSDEFKEKFIKEFDYFVDLHN